MISLLIAYTVLSLAGVALLCHIILRIGAMMGDCPNNGPAFRVSATSVATGFAAIGVGGTVLIGSLIVIVPNAPIAGFIIALGLAALCLGLGFTQAVATLRAVTDGIADARANKAAGPELAV